MKIESLKMKLIDTQMRIDQDIICMYCNKKLGRRSFSYMHLKKNHPEVFNSRKNSRGQCITIEGTDFKYIDDNDQASP